LANWTDSPGTAALDTSRDQRPLSLFKIYSKKMAWARSCDFIFLFSTTSASLNAFQKPILNIKMSFSKTYGNVITPFVKQYEQAKNEKQRKTVLNNAADAVQKSKLLLENEENLPKDLPNVRIYYIIGVLLFTYMALLSL
jgi:hypothetical protein